MLLPFKQIKQDDKWIVGIDLHGTLLNKDWEVKPELMAELIEIIDEVRKSAKVVICTGNDFSFVKEKLPEELLSHFDGCVIETGCAITDMEGNATTLVDDAEKIAAIQTLRTRFKAEQKRFPELKYFGPRDHTISMFTRDENGGPEPKILLPMVKQIVKEEGLEELIDVTYSNVAVDIVPKGFNKNVGLREAGKQLWDSGKVKTVGMADAMNDEELIAESDISFVPANVENDLWEAMGKRGKEFRLLEHADQADIDNPEVILMATKEDTRGVIECLRFFKDKVLAT